MSEHPISELLQISMAKIREMIDVNIVVGSPIEMNGSLIIPVSKVRCGFVSGGIDQKRQRFDDENLSPFGGGAGGTMTITPVAFLVCQGQDVKILHLEESSHLYDRIIDGITKIFEQVFPSKKDQTKENDPLVYTVEK